MGANTKIWYYLPQRRSQGTRLYLLPNKKIHSLFHSEIDGFPELRKRKHENRMGGNWLAPLTFSVPFLSRLSHSLRDRLKAEQR